MKKALATLALLLVTAPASAQSVDAIFRRGNQAFAEGRYDDAVAAYQELEALGVDDPDVSFDRGLAEARAGRLGRAMVAFEHTLRLRPGDDDARRALEAAEATLARIRAARTGEAETRARGNLLEGLSGALTERAWALGLLGSLFVACVAAAGLLFAGRESLRLGLGSTAAVGALVASLAGLGLAARTGAFQDGAPAIVVGEGVTLLDTPDPRARTTGRLDEGERVQVLGKHGDFYDVTGPGHARGWARARDVGRY